MLLTGWISLKRIGVDLFPDINIPIVSVTTIYPGAGPEELETSVSKPLEEELSSIGGLKRIRSRNQEGVSIVIAEFTLSTDIKYAEQQVRDKTARVRAKFPDNAKEPVIVRFDPSDQPILKLSVFADLEDKELYDLTKETIVTKLEQVNNVGSVKISGGRRREIHVEFDRDKLNSYKISLLSIVNQLKNSGVNVPIGDIEKGSSQKSYRTIGQFKDLKQIEDTIISFGGELGNGIQIKDLAKVKDAEEDKSMMGFLYADPEFEEKELGFLQKTFLKYSAPQKKREYKKALFLDVYRQSGSNTVEVVDSVFKSIEKINTALKGKKGNPKIILVRDGSKIIKWNIEDVSFAIILGIILAVIVVYFFLGNVRSTIITGLALPNSLLGAFVIMYAMGFTMNVMTLIALSLAVGLLVDDAIVVRENIYRKLEEGHGVREASILGTNEVTLAVVGTSLAVIAVFLPIGFLSGIIGQFFKQFGLTVVFAMIISLFDGLFVAPMLSNYFAGDISKLHHKNKVILAFDSFQKKLEEIYVKIMHFSLKYPWAILLITVIVLGLSIFSLKFVKKTFMPPNDAGEFLISLETLPGTSLTGMYEVTKKLEEKLKKLPEIDAFATTIGNGNETNIPAVNVILLSSQYRKRTTVQVKEEMRTFLEENLKDYRPRVNDYSALGGVQFPFNLNLSGENIQALDEYSKKLLPRLKQIPDLVDLDTDYRSGKPEFRVIPDLGKMKQVGVTPVMSGLELRYQIEGEEVSKLDQNGLEYSVVVRLKEEQRDLEKYFNSSSVPNIQNKLIPLSQIARGENGFAPARIIREDRSRVVPISANLSAKGAIASATEKAVAILEKEIPIPPGVSYKFVGQSEDFKELIANIVLAFGLAILFIYLVLASLYESFITPITILFAIPPAISGAFFGLLIFGEMLNLFSMMGLILLMGLVAKNSILLVDHAMQAIRAGKDRNTAILEAGESRLRPILMTSLAMIAGTLPIALGIGEAAKVRTAMGVAIIGGLVLSTLITLIVVPSFFGYIDRFRVWVESKFQQEEKVVESKTAEKQTETKKERKNSKKV